MKTKKEIVEEAQALVKQIKLVEKDYNIAAQKRLEQRLLALLWVLEAPKAPKHLTFSKDSLNVLRAFW